VDDVSTSNNGKTITLTTMSLLAAIRSATINKGSPRHTARGYVVAGLGTTTPIFYGTVPEIESPRVNKNVLGNIALQIGETLVLARTRPRKTRLKSRMSQRGGSALQRLRMPLKCAVRALS
jgi:hypothetical protein